MTNASDRAPQAAEGEAPNHPLLELRFERLRALRSAFGALAPSAVSAAGRDIAESGRELTRRLALAKLDADAPAANGLAQIDASLDAFASTMRRLACSVAVAQLRSTLPGRLTQDRRSVLDLLDLFLGDGIEDEAELTGRIGSIDYLITLLCTQGARRPGVVAHDPVSLSPRVAALGAQWETIDDPALSEIETEFFSAANMDVDRVREETQRRSLRQRKVELGKRFFAPRVLRAIVTYNAAQLERVTDAILDAGDWGIVDAGSGSETSFEVESGSVFESTKLRRIAAVVRRRIHSEVLPDGVETRIAMALEIETLEPTELEAIAQESVGSPEDLIGTAILVGLLGRSLTLLSLDLQSLGLSPDEVSDAWVDELDARFRSEIDERLARDAYKPACALTELKNKFLFAPLANRLREEHVLTHSVVRRAKPSPESLAPASPSTSARPTAPAKTTSEGNQALRTPRAIPDRTAAPGKPAKSEPRGRARDLVREALEEDRRARAPTATSGGTRSGVPWVRIAQAAVVVVSIAVGIQLYLGRASGDLHAFSREQLGLLSPFLVDGQRNGKGNGPGFVGTLDERWTGLSPDERQTAAEMLVLRLRERGLQQVMIYDRNHALRIQAIGSQPIRTL